MKNCQFMKQEALPLGYEVVGSLSPGQLNWPIIEQCRLFQLVPTVQIGVHLTYLGTIVHRKSISMVIGMGLERTAWTRAKICNLCNLNKTCPYGIET